MSIPLRRRVEISSENHALPWYRSYLLRAGWKVDGERRWRNPILNAVDKSLPDLCRGFGKIFSDCAIRAGTSARAFYFPNVIEQTLLLSPVDVGTRATSAVPSAFHVAPEINSVHHSNEYFLRTLRAADIKRDNTRSRDFYNAHFQ